MNRKILLLLSGLMLTCHLSAQGRIAGKDGTFVDPGAFVTETPLPETSGDRAAREAKDKTRIPTRKTPPILFAGVIKRHYL